MSFKSTQVLNIIGISEHTLRVWKKHLSPISEKDGRTAFYSMAELLAIGIVAQAVRGLGIPISQLSSVAGPLFDEVERYRENSGSGSSLLITPNGVEILCVSGIPDHPVFALIRIQVICRAIEAKIRGEQPSAPEQLNLPISN